MSKLVSGFSKFSKEEKIEWLAKNYFANKTLGIETLKQYLNRDEKLQQLHDEFIENTISNFYVPYAVAPNFIINGREYAIPMAIEESSVVAAASLVAKFWSIRGGFRAHVLSTTKVGQIHFMYDGNFKDLSTYFRKMKKSLIEATDTITQNMRKRGGGIVEIDLLDKSDELPNYYQLYTTFETCDSMGANFINSCLEAIAREFKNKEIKIIMGILSNYVPDCLVRAEVSCDIEDFFEDNSSYYAEKFVEAVQIANVDPYRAVTHNKGIMNGIDAVVLATGNDFRAVEAGVHAYAAKDGKYSSLTHCTITDGIFKFWIEIPLALGTVGGLTNLHPLVKFSMEMLQKPTAKDLMNIVAVAGLAQNFGAIKSLTTTGIQEGHMKMHLMNILNQFEATENEKVMLVEHFKTNVVTHSAVVEAIKNIRP